MEVMTETERSAIYKTRDSRVRAKTIYHNDKLVWTGCKMSDNNKDREGKTISPRKTELAEQEGSITIVPAGSISPPLKLYTVQIEVTELQEFRVTGIDEFDAIRKITPLTPRVNRATRSEIKSVVES